MRNATWILLRDIADDDDDDEFVVGVIKRRSIGEHVRCFPSSKTLIPLAKILSLAYSNSMINDVVINFAAFFSLARILHFTRHFCRRAHARGFNFLITLALHFFFSLTALLQLGARQI